MSSRTGGRQAGPFGPFRHAVAGGLSRLLLGLVIVLLSLGQSGASGSNAEATTSPRHRVVQDASRGPAPASIPQLHGRVPFLTILCKFADAAEEPASPAEIERLMGDEYPGLGDYWRTVSYGAISLEGSVVRGWYTMPRDSRAYVSGAENNLDGGSGALPDLQRLADDCSGAISGNVDWTSFYGLNFVFSSDLGPPLGGRICISPDGISRCYGATWIWASRIRDQAAWAHEMGHAFGLKHSSLNATVTYDNVWDVMSDTATCGRSDDFGRIGQEPIAYDKDILGWIPHDRAFVAEPGSVSTIELARLAAPGPQGYLMARIPIPGENPASPSPGSSYYTVEARRFAGYDANLSGEAVVIHEIDPGREIPAQPVPRQSEGEDRVSYSGFSGAMWTPGTTFRDAHHSIAVAVERATETGFVITIATGRPLPPDADAAARAQASAGITVVGKPSRVAAVPQTLAPDGAPSGAVSTTDKHGNSYAIWAASNGRFPPGGVVGYAASQGDIYFAYRAAAGEWEAKVKVNSESAPFHSSPTIAVDGSGNAYAVWVASSPGRSDIYSAFRPNGARGGTRSGWSDSVRVNDNENPAPQWFPTMAIDEAGNAYVSWIDNRAGHIAVYFAQRHHDLGGEPSSDGWTWSTNIKVADSPAIRFAFPSLVVDRVGKVYLAWEQSRPCSGSDIYVAVRAANGSWGVPTPISENATGMPLTSPRLMVSGSGEIYAEWQKDRGEFLDLYVSRCSQGCETQGAGETTWSAPIQVGRSVRIGSEPTSDIHAEGDLACLAWPEGTGQEACLEGGPWVIGNQAS